MGLKKTPQLEKRDLWRNKKNKETKHMDCQQKALQNSLTRIMNKIRNFNIISVNILKPK